MAEPPLGPSTVIGLGPPEDGLLRGVSPETLRELHDDELRTLRSNTLKHAAMTALCGSVWIASAVMHESAGKSFLAGYITILPLSTTLRYARQWRIARLRDPIANATADAAESARALASARDQAARFSARRPYASLAIAVAIIVIGLIEFVVAGSAARALAVVGLDRTKVAAGEWWRLLTSSFVHVDGPNAWSSVAVLMGFGTLIEAYTSRFRLVLAYLAAVVTGSLASLWLLPNFTSAGASGGILGVAGFLYALSRRRPGEVPKAYGNAAIWFIVLMAVVGAIGYRFLNNAAHAGGAVAGFLVGWLTVPRELPQAERSSARYDDDRMISILGAAAVVVLAVAAVFTGAKIYIKPPKPVTSVHAAITPRYSGGFNVTLENLKDVSLEAYTLEVYDSGLPLFEQWRDEEGFDTHGTSTGPIAPHGFLVVPLGELRRPLRQPSVQIAAAVFADGTFEGTLEQYDIIVARRMSAADDADYMVAVIDQARKLPPDKIVDFVDAKVAARTAANTSAKQRTYTGDVSILLRSDADRPEQFAADVQAERARLVKLSADLRSSIR
jgi:membrane associated rhomboid family serine protease